MTASIATRKRIINLDQRVNLVTFNMQVSCFYNRYKDTQFWSQWQYWVVYPSISKQKGISKTNIINTKKPYSFPIYLEYHVNIEIMLKHFTRADPLPVKYTVEIITATTQDYLTDNTRLSHKQLRIISPITQDYQTNNTRLSHRIIKSKISKITKYYCQ